MQSKTPLLMVTALVCGLGAAFGTWKLVSGAQAAPAEDTKVSVLVPVMDITPYHLFQDNKKFTTVEIPKSKLRESQEDTIVSFDQIKGKQSRHYKLRTNEPFYKNDICENADNDIVERLRSGEVAQSIKATPDTFSGGFIKVGDRVDIMATIMTQGEQARTQYILEDIEVLAVDTSSQKDPTVGATPMSRIVLRLTREQGPMLKFYHDSCKLDAVRRKPGDSQKVGDAIAYSAPKRPGSVGGNKEDELEPVKSGETPVIKNETLPEPKAEVAKEPAKDEGTMKVARDVDQDLKVTLDAGTGVKSKTFSGLIKKRFEEEVPKSGEKKDKNKNAEKAEEPKKTDKPQENNN